MTKSTKKPSSNDAISMLIHDHEEVKSAFKKFLSLGDRAFTAKKALADEICMALSAHATAEEEIFYPAVREQVKGSDDMVDEAFVEHASAKDLIEQIRTMGPEDEFFDAKVKVLSELIDHHVGEEEDEMFVKVRKSNIDLVALGEEIAACKEQLNQAEMPPQSYGSARKKPTQPHSR